MAAEPDSQPVQAIGDRNATAFDRAVQRALRNWLDTLATEPMTVAVVAGYFGKISLKIMRRILEQMEGAEQLPAAYGGTGRLWRVPLSKMPPKYLIKIGLLKPP